MPTFDQAYVSSLIERFDNATENLYELIEGIVDGRVAPSKDDIPIGSARRFSGAVMFFDIREFTRRTSQDNDELYEKTLYLLNAVIPIVMHVVFDFGGYVEKNTGDGIMGVFGLEESDELAALKAVCAAITIRYVINHVVNPHLTLQGIDPVHWRIGIDLGSVLLARIGTNTGSSKYERNFLTVVGTTANIASKMQHEAQTDEILIGDIVKRNLPPEWAKFAEAATPADWNWTYMASGEPYQVWAFRADWSVPDEA